MKRRILPMLLAMMLLFGIASSGFTVNNDLIPFPDQTYTYGYHYFHSGLAPVLTDDGWRYITTDGRLVDYGHMYIFDYSEGYAAFADFVGGELLVGYMDANGNTVIPAKYDIFEFGSGRVGAGRVIGGNVLVYDRESNSWDQIDLYGRTVSRTMEPVDGSTLYSDWFGNTDGVTYETVVIDGDERRLGFSEGYALTDGYIVRGEGASEDTTTDPTDEPKQSSELEIFINERYIIYQTDVGLIYGGLVTNHTGEKVSGSYALMIYKLTGEYNETVEVVQFFTMDFDLEDGESVSCEIHTMYTGLSQQNMCWIKFDSEAEREAFFNDSNLSREFGQCYAIFKSVSWLEGKLGTELP